VLGGAGDLVHARGIPMRTHVGLDAQAESAQDQM
jgi:hypothetical protein